MRERPILFSAPMVRAILDGSKTQTRRVVKEWTGKVDGKAIPSDVAYLHDFTCYRANCPYGQPGDRLWVRETWGYNPDFPGMASRACYRADPGHEHDGIKWKPSIHMPRSMCRLVLEITGVRVERLQNISDADAEAEGIDFLRHVPDVDETLTARELFMCLWDGADWKSNPWVWVIEFERVDGAKGA